MTADDVIRRLGLEPHPEGGHFRECFRAPARVTSSAHGAERSAATAIYFLLRSGEFSAFHRVRSDEIWHHYLGDPLELHCIQGGAHSALLLGADLATDGEPLRVIPAGAWQAARPRPGGHGFALCGCTVAPGFEFADFELPERRALLALLPEHAAIVEALTR